MLNTDVRPSARKGHGTSAYNFKALHHSTAYSKGTKDTVASDWVRRELEHRISDYLGL